MNFFHRRYRDKEKSTRPTSPTTITATIQKSSSDNVGPINVSVNPKSISSTIITTAPVKSTSKPPKKIDMGAASNYGREAIGINSPTHRNTHNEENLFGTTVPTSSSNENQNDLLDDIFKTCPTPTTPDIAQTIQSTNDDDFFNPREEERDQEFGDFASAFGNPAAAQVASPEPVDVISKIEKKDEFADFGSAFSSTNITTSFTSDNNSSLLNISNAPLTNLATSNVSPVNDLLSDLDGLTLSAPISNGK